MEAKPLRELDLLGQSVWLDYIRRDMIKNGELRSFIEEDGLKGMTSNPSIFEKAISNSNDYDEQIQLILQDKSYLDIYEAIVLQDIQEAADEFRRVYENSRGKDGYVSLEVNPHFAHSTQDTLEEARRLWTALNRPNVFIKVPATDEALPAIRQLISEGININVTLLFGLPRYQQVINAYVTGIEERLAQGLPIDTVTSVASFFVSRMDSLVDPLLEKIVAQHEEKSPIAQKLLGQTAIANAKAAYQIFKKFFSSDQFKNLSSQGAKIQRLLWASTSTKNPAYNDVVYIESLIGPNTINTMPMETFNAYRHHGNPLLRIEHDLETSKWALEQLPELGIIYDKIIQQLEDEGSKKFVEPFDKLMDALTKKGFFQTSHSE